MAVIPTPTLEYSVRATDEAVEILDRRVFPFEVSWVRCATVEEVAVAIETMVTQSLGPFFAATAGMVLAAREVAATASNDAEALMGMRAAGERLVMTRPTNNHIRDAVAHILSALATADSLDGQLLVSVAASAAAEAEAHVRAGCDVLGRHAASLVPTGSRVLTHCWADLYIIGLARALLTQGTSVEFLCTETRPYLQGARLTAHTLGEMGYEPTLLTDSMPAWAMQQGLVDRVITAADRVTMDGHVVNKVGTLQLAIAANAFDVPFHVMVAAPDRMAPSLDRVRMEMRDGNEVLQTLGRPSATPLARGLYPAFDATPPRWITSIATDRGVFNPNHLADYYTGEPTSSD